MQNLIELQSQSMSTFDTLGEYQRLFINARVGEITTKNRLKTQRNKVLNFHVENLDAIWEALECEYDCYGVGKYIMHILEDDFIATFSWLYQATYIGMRLTVLAKDIKHVNSVIARIEKSLEKWLTKEDIVFYTILQNDETQELNETTYNDVLDVTFNPLALPFIENVDEYIEDFLSSKAPLLILQGEAGTGKTTFVKQILQTMQKQLKPIKEEFNVTYSFDESVFFLSDFYKRIIYDDYDVLVLEDINQMLVKNSDEGVLNPINKFLSVTDGLVSKYKKIIITTNIESKHQIAPALLRPGRCFDALAFRKLEGEEIEKLSKSYEKEIDTQVEEINLSEFYAKLDDARNTKLLSHQVGF